MMSFAELHGPMDPLPQKYFLRHRQRGKYRSPSHYEKGRAPTCYPCLLPLPAAAGSCSSTGETVAQTRDIVAQESAFFMNKHTLSRIPPPQ